MKPFFVLLALLSILVLIVSTSDKLMKMITEYRLSTKSFLGSDKYRYGDLYGMSYLPNFRIEVIKLPEKVSIDRSGERNINLFIVGDSYLESDFVKTDSI